MKKRRHDENRGQRDIEDKHNGREKLCNFPQITDVCLKTSFLPAQMWDVHMWIEAAGRMEMKIKHIFF